jgi:ferredoxin
VLAVERRLPAREGYAMAFVVTQPCHDCKYTDCVCVCPCDCFYQDDSMLYINPVDCIDCEACVPECPVEAIFRDSEVPAQWLQYVELNAERTKALAASGQEPVTERQEPKEGPGCSARK